MYIIIYIILGTPISYYICILLYIFIYIYNNNIYNFKFVIYIYILWDTLIRLLIASIHFKMKI